jgi:hypothetical protein
MTMHLAHPALTTTGKKKGPRKWASAEQKREAEQRDQDWQAFLKQQGIADEGRRRQRAMTSGVLTSSPRIPPGRETPYIASRDTGWTACTKKSDQEYTGSKVLGISTLHKSNGVPVFSQEEAIDISKMRRG